MAAQSDPAGVSRPNVFAGASLTGFVYFCAATASLLLSHGPYGFAPLWPANAILLAVLLQENGRSWPYLAVCLIASFAANRMAGVEWLGCVGFSVANLIEPVLFRRWLGKFLPGQTFSFASGRALICFSAIAVACAAISGIVATLFAPGAYTTFFISWFLADFLGMLIVTPLALVVARGAWRHVFAMSRSRVIELLALFGAVTLVSLSAFLQTTYPLLFLPLAVMMAMVVRFGTIGASVSVLVIAGVALIATGLGRGPIVEIQLGRLEEAFFVQGYLLVLYVAALPTAALLGTQRRLLARLRENVRLLNLAEAAAHMGHWRFALDDAHLFWSDETFRIHGLPVGTPPSIEESIAAYVEEDRACVRDMFRRALNEGQAYEFRARIRRRDSGAIRDVLSRGNIDFGSNGQIVAVYGMIQDVTVQSEQERTLTRARIVAEEAAAAARLASETDPLTGLPNRRQLLIVLERAREQAADLRQPLSIAILDIDHFKRVNDTYGHVIGDSVLQRVAQAAVSALRGTDLIGRFGGEEFIIVLPNAPIEIAETIADRVRTTIEADGAADRSRPGVTASLGIAEWQPDEAITSLLQRADEALYGAKRSGRNRVLGNGIAAEVN